MESHRETEGQLLFTAAISCRMEKNFFEFENIIFLWQHLSQPKNIDVDSLVSSSTYSSEPYLI